MKTRLVAVVLLLGAGMLLAACKKKESASATPAADAAEDSAIAARVEPSPPPAGPVKGGRLRLTAGTPAGGEGRLDSAVFRSTLSAQRAAIQACYDEGLKGAPDLVGELTFLLTIRPDGTVEAAVETDAERLAQAGVSACVAGRLAAMSFAAAPPVGGEFRLRLPMSFLPVKE
jgi:hypothetical protein